MNYLLDDGCLRSIDRRVEVDIGLPKLTDAIKNCLMVGNNCFIDDDGYVTIVITTYTCTVT